MSSEVRKFFPEAEKVWHKDYQCNYYRGVIIDGEDHIVERCTVLRAEYEGGLYRFRYLNQNAATSTWIAGKSKSVIGPMISTAMDKVGKAEQNFF